MFFGKRVLIEIGIESNTIQWFRYTSDKNKHSESIAQAMHQYKSLTGTTEFKTISFDVLKTFRENYVRYIFFLSTNPTSNEN